MQGLLPNYWRYLQMENSKAYKHLIEQINATGSQRFDGYYPRMLEDIFDWERDEVEDIIWKTFHQDKDMNLASFLPQLKKYDGIGALKELLARSIIPSYASVAVSSALYEYTGDDNYLDIIKQNIDKSKGEISYVAILSYCKPCRKAYDLLVEIYINSDDTTNRSTAILGILYNKGFIVDPLNMHDRMATTELSRKFFTDDVNERKTIIKMLETGQFEKFKGQFYSKNITGYEKIELRECDEVPIPPC